MASFAPPSPPEFKPYDIQMLDTGGAAMDRQYYQRSDQDFKRRHKGLFKANKLFEASVLKDQEGESELMPAIQSELTRAGLGSALGAFGDAPGTLKAGSAGEASVARNLGLGVMQFQDRNRANRMGSLGLANGLFQPRTFGLSGENAVQLAMQNTTNENNYNQANFANQMQMAQYNQQAGAQGEAADAQKKQAMIAGGAAILGTVALVF